jgi:large subunit ribosomal protein L18
VKQAKRINRQRRRRRWRVRNALKAHSTRPRLSVFRSHKHIYAQVIDDEAGRTVAFASTLDKDLRATVAYGGNVAAAVEVGKRIARRALEAGVKQAAFDRREYKYHGRIAALADAARDAGLDLGAKPPAPEPEPDAKKPPKPAKKEKPAKKPPAAEAAKT